MDQYPGHYMEQRMDAVERTLRGSNGDDGVVSRQRVVMSEQARQKEDLDRLDRAVCDPITGLVQQMVAVNIFVTQATKFIEDFRGQTTKIMVGVIGTVIGGILLQLFLNYVVFRQK